MSKKVLYFFFLFLVFLNIKSTTFADVLTCDIKASCASSDVRMTYLSSTTNAHVEFAGGASNFPRSICCSSNGATVASTTLQVVETDRTEVTASSCSSLVGKVLFTFPGVQPSNTIFTTNQNLNNVSKITPAGVSSILGTTGSAPYGITVDSAGNVYTANSNSSNVSKITPAGVSSILGTTGSDPYGITVDSAGNVYTSNRNSSNVSKITPAGVSSILGTTGSTPYGITVDSAGNVYTSDNGSSTVSKITPQGVSSVLGATGGTGNFSITIDPAGNIYVPSSGAKKVSKITPAGASSILGSTAGQPQAITIDTVGNVYTTDINSSYISKITAAGVSSILATVSSYSSTLFITPTNGGHIGSSTAYQREACLIASSTPWNVSTAFQSGSCSGYGTTVLSMSQPGDNASVGASSTYSTKLCLTAWTNPSLSFSISDTAISFGGLSPAQTTWATNVGGTSTQPVGTTKSFAISTTVSNMPGGFSLYVSGGTLQNNASSTITIAPMSVAGVFTPGTDQFGIQARRDTTSSTITTTLNPNYSGTNYYFDASTSTLSLLSTTAGGSDGTLQLFINVGANVSSLKPPGTYTSNMVLILVPNF